MRTLDSATAVWTPSAYTIAVIPCDLCAVDRLFLSFGISEMEVFVLYPLYLGKLLGLLSLPFLVYKKKRGPAC